MYQCLIAVAMCCCVTSAAGAPNDVAGRLARLEVRVVALEAEVARLRAKLANVGGSDAQDGRPDNAIMRKIYATIPANLRPNGTEWPDAARRLALSTLNNRFQGREIEVAATFDRVDLSPPALHVTVTTTGAYPSMIKASLPMNGSTVESVAKLKPGASLTVRGKIDAIGPHWYQGSEWRVYVNVEDAQIE